MYNLNFSGEHDAHGGDKAAVTDRLDNVRNGGAD
jgi:hypothetical protein